MRNLLVWKQALVFVIQDGACAFHEISPLRIRLRPRKVEMTLLYLIKTVISNRQDGGSRESAGEKSFSMETVF
jgi:hypothetical protein